MKKLFTKFNIVCLFLDIIFLLGIVWVWQLSDNIKQITTNKQQIVEVDITMFDRHLERIRPPAEESKDPNEERDSSTSSVSTTDFAQNDEVVSPKEFLLSVPFTSQAPEKNWDQPWQDACEEAALLMMDAYYKNYNLSPLFVRDEILKMVDWEKEKSWGYSIEIEKVKEMASEYFSLDHLTTTSPNHLRIIENPTIEQIKSSIINGNPVLVVADGKVLPNPHFRNGGPVYHALIIRGFDEDEFITNDPGTQFGENFKYKYEDLLNAIHEWNGGDVKNGRKVILVIE